MQYRSVGVAMADDGASKKVDVYDGIVDDDGAPEAIRYPNKECWRHRQSSSRSLSLQIEAREVYLFFIKWLIQNEVW